MAGVRAEYFRPRTTTVKLLSALASSVTANAGMTENRTPSPAATCAAPLK